MSHHAINRYLRGDRLTPRLVWKHARSQMETSAHGYLVFDDAVPGKNFLPKIDMRRQYGKT